jgi:hypothetical protein
VRGLQDDLIVSDKIEGIEPGSIYEVDEVSDFTTRHRLAAFSRRGGRCRLGE